MPGGDWDPGSTALPVATAVVMIACSLYLTLKEYLTNREREKAAAPGDGRAAAPQTKPRREAPAHSRSETAADPRATLRLSMLTVAVLAIYVAGFRQLGFVLTTSALLFTLTYYYQLGDVRLRAVHVLLRHGGLGVLATLVVFYLGVTALRWSRYFGRIWEVEILRNRAFTAFLGVLLWAAVLLPVFLYVKRRYLDGVPREAEQAQERGPSEINERGVVYRTAAWRALMIAVPTTLLLYLVFQQLFRVALPLGVLA